jgi:hypothetical protein
VDLILINDGLFQLVSVTKEMMKNVTLLDKIDCFELCDILRIYLTTYHEPPFNVHVMNDGTGNLMGCLCR